MILVPPPSPKIPPIENHEAPYCMLRNEGGVKGETRWIYGVFDDPQKKAQCPIFAKTRRKLEF